jgi:hypothetical protein
VLHAAPGATANLMPTRQLLWELQVKLRCLHCGSHFSARNPSRTVGDHMKACRKFEGELPDTLRVKVHHTAIY